MNTTAPVERPRRYGRVLWAALLFLPGVMFALQVWLKASSGLAMLWIKEIEHSPHDATHTAVMLAGVLVCFCVPASLVLMGLRLLFTFITDLVGVGDGGSKSR